MHSKHLGISTETSHWLDNRGKMENVEILRSLKCVYLDPGKKIEILYSEG